MQALMAEVVVVEVRGRRLAVATARVREVAAVSTVTPVPSAPPPVVGLMQLRGQILPVIDVTSGERPPVRPNDPLIVIELGLARAALLVDRVVGISVDEAVHQAELLDVGALFDELRKKVSP